MKSPLKARKLSEQVTNDNTETVVYCDGSGPPQDRGKDGWGALIVRNGKIAQRLHGSSPLTTVNRMEMTAAIRTLEMTTEEGIVLVCSDSRYLVNAFNKGNLKRWLSNGWQTLRGTLVRNRDLAERLVELVREKEIRFRWVPAGSHPHNVEADRLSREWKAEGIGTC